MDEVEELQNIVEELRSKGLNNEDSEGRDSVWDLVEKELSSLHNNIKDTESIVDQILNRVLGISIDKETPKDSVNKDIVAPFVNRVGREINSMRSSLYNIKKMLNKLL